MHLLKQLEIKVIGTYNNLNPKDPVAMGLFSQRSIRGH